MKESKNGHRMVPHGFEVTGYALVAGGLKATLSLPGRQKEYSGESFLSKKALE